MISQSKSAQQREWFQQLLTSDGVESTSELADHLVSDPDWLHQLRIGARKSITKLPALHRKQEAWRYNRVNNIFNNRFDPTFYNDHDVSQINLEEYLLPALKSYRLVFFNGHYVTTLSDNHELPDGVTLGSLADAILNKPDQFVHLFNNSHQQNAQRFTALNNALFNDGVYLHINQSVKLNRPVEIIYINNNQARSTLHDGSMIQTRNIIHLQKRSSATVLEHFVSSNNKQKYFYNNVTDIYLDDDAQLNHIRLQDESRQAHHLSNLSVTLKKKCHYHSTSIASGAAWSKTHINVDFKAKQSECDLHGLYTVGNQQLTDFHLDVRHSVPACRSREQFKGIIYGKGRAVFDGRILVDKQAQLSDAALTNDNLLLVHDAEVDIKPQLEIYADDVKCSHGTTVGRLNPQQLFYLRSRGINEHDARRMLCQGFAADIVGNIGLPVVQNYVTEKITSTLKSVESDMVDGDA